MEGLDALITFGWFALDVVCIVSTFFMVSIIWISWNFYLALFAGLDEERASDQRSHT